MMRRQLINRAKVGQVLRAVGSIAGLLLFFLVFNGLISAVSEPERAGSAGPAPTPTPITDEPTSEWRVYANFEQDFTINYPPDWEREAWREGVVDVDVTIFRSSGKSYVQSMVTQLRPGGWTFRDIIDNDKIYLSEATETRGVVGGASAIRISGYLNERANPAQQGYYWEGIYTERGDKVYRIILLQDPLESHVDAFHGMLSTVALPTPGE